MGVWRNFITLWTVLLLQINEIQTTSFQTWLRNEEISDGIATSSLLLSSPADSLVYCVQKCTKEPTCVMIGYSATLGVCDLYPESFSAMSPLTFQESTLFYRPSEACEQDGYTYLWSADVCLKVSSDVASFTDARSSCQSEGGDLASITTDELYNYLEANLEFDKRYRTGATQTPGNLSSWFWVDGSPVSPDIWTGIEPNGMLEECMELRFYTRGSVYVNDIGCTEKLYYVCEKRN